MQIPEQFGDFEEYLRVHFQRYQSGIWTALPLVVNKWNYPASGHNTVHAVPGVAGLKRQSDGSWASEPMPELPDVPVHFMGGGGFFMTHPISQGDEGIGIFSSRCLDGWWQQGGKNIAQPDYAHDFMHEIGDAMFIPTRMSKAKVLPGISQTSAQIRSEDGTSFIEMLGAGAGFNFVTSGGAVRIDGSGNLTATGEITRGQGTAGSVTLGHHNHPTAPPGPVSPPTPGT